ncbi:MAG: helix-turn-helix transcriptional regulator [Erysipelotrichaceae bacterium]|nr:helix-turn-helix transcriptional regulator [Erysipelotrichaceae bacterium]
MKDKKIKPEMIRIMLEMKQEEFAKKLGLTVRTYQYRITGRTKWKGCELALMSDLGGVPIDQIDF